MIVSFAILPPILREFVAKRSLAANGAASHAVRTLPVDWFYQ